MDSWIQLHTFRRVANHFLNVDIDLISPFFCRFNEYQPFVACNIAVIIETIITLDRYLLIVHKDQFKIFKKKSFRITLISFIVVYSLLINIHLPLYYRLDEVSTTNGTTKICHISNREWKINSTFFLINVISVSFIINPILDFKLIYHIFSTRNQGRLFTRSSIINRNFAISAIGLNLNNLILELPIFIGVFFSEFFNLRAENTRIIFIICYCLGLIEKTDVFFINILMSSIFRQEFLSMIGFSKTRIDNEVLMSSSIVLRRRRKVPSKVVEK